MRVEELIARLGQEIHLPGFALNDEGMGRLIFDGHTTVDFQYDKDADTVYLTSMLDRVPTEHQAEVYEKLLIGNLFCRQTRGAVLAVSPLEQEIVLTRAVPVASAEIPAFLGIVESFVAAAEEWAAQLAQAAMDRAMHQADAGESTDSLVARGIRA